MKRIPYLVRRGNVFHFRIDVPADVRAKVGAREIVRTLATESRLLAVPRALRFGAIAKALFAELRSIDMTEDRMVALLREKKRQLEIARIHEEHDEALFAERKLRINDVRIARLEGENAALQAALRGGHLGVPHGLLSPVLPPCGSTSTAQAAPPVLLSQIVGKYLGEFADSKSAMLKKHRIALPLFLEVVGDKSIKALRQSDINAYFDLVSKLPPGWSLLAKREKTSPKDIARAAHPKTLSKETFESTYRSSLSMFLVAAKRDWMDDGFPTHLTMDGIVYKGKIEDAGRRQRAFRTDELSLLFRSDILLKARADEGAAHFFWLPALGLYSGARVNELCQINPQTDILQDAATGIWYLWITSHTASDDRIVKSMKKPTAKRRIPIHSALMDAGFLEYFNRVRSAGSKLLFPGWEPESGRASPAAEDWFKELLRALGLRDETHGARLVGMHAFRSTLLARARNSVPPVDAGCITGHVGLTSAVQRGYEGDLDLTNLQKILESIDFKFSL